MVGSRRFVTFIITGIHFSSLSAAQVPQYQPTRAFELFKRFLHDEPF
eukprot:COSAG01_NODE_1623_length_9708_cov_32.044438_9_plen_47_part_00